MQEVHFVGPWVEHLQAWGPQAQEVKGLEGEREALVEKDGAGGDGSASDGEGGERSSLMPRK